jgi:hypothetical protein
MKIWVIKQFVMTRFFIFTALFLAALSFNPGTSLASDNSANHTQSTSNKETGLQEKNAHETSSKSVPESQSAKSHLPVEKSHSYTPSMDELPHIHKFHKERVKKIKKHQSKLWILSKIVLVLCHISILIISFLHVTH